MTLNLVVPVGEIKFVLFDDRDASNTRFQEIIISRKNYCRLTVPPMVWMGFQGLSNDGSMLLNIANIEHDPGEVDRLEIDKMNYNWSIS
jgi:dTDP-4-dehydrorhamnose 3,5-epimerase